MFSKKVFDRFVRKYGTPTAILLGAAVIGISIYLSFGAPNKPIAGSEPNLTVPQAPPARVEIDTAGFPVSGEAEAPVTMVEFSDFQCPFCRKFWREALPRIKSEYIDTGKVRFVYRDFPLPFHPGAEVAAEAALCAGDEGKFWEMHDQIFAEQDKQGEGTVQFTETDVRNWGFKLGLSEEQFFSCLDTGKYEAKIKKDLADGQAAGVEGTPTIFINGLRVVGAQPFEVFAQIIETELQKN